MQVLTLDMTHPGLRELSWGIRTGGKMFERATGLDLWTWLDVDAQRNAIFNCGMTVTDRACGKSYLHVAVLQHAFKLFCMVTAHLSLQYAAQSISRPCI